MPVLFVARSVKLGRWGSDVGQGKHVYKVGVADGDPKALAAAGWAGEGDWKIVKSREVEMDSDGVLVDIDTPDALAGLRDKVKPTAA